MRAFSKTQNLEMAIKAEGYIQRFAKISLHWIRRVSLCLLAFKGRRLTASDPFHILFALLVLAERNILCILMQRNSEKGCRKSDVKIISHRNN